MPVDLQATPCWCDSGKFTQDCCQPILIQRAKALTAQALMRARYSAFVTLNEAFLLDSWAPATRPTHIDFDTSQRWLGLKIRQTDRGDCEDSEGEVEFVARYKIAGRGFRLIERSQFCRDKQGWQYLQGEQLSK